MGITDLFTPETLGAVFTTGGSGVLSFFGHAWSQAQKNKHEERKWQYKITNKELDQDAADVQSARQMTDPYQSTTRRYYVFGLLILIVGIYNIAPFFHIPLNEIITKQHAVLFFKWTTIQVITVGGIIYSQTMLMFISAFVGYYAGRTTHKIVS